MSYVVLTQNSTYVFTCSLHSFNMGYGKNGTGKNGTRKHFTGKNGTRKNWHYVNLEKMAPYLFYGLLQSMGKLIATCHKTSHESMFEFLLIAIYFKHTQL